MKYLLLNLNGKIMNTSITYNDLAPVERQVADLYVAGFTKKEIAMERKRSYYTVDTQVKALFEKTDVHKDTEFCLWYFITRFKISFDLSVLQRTITTVSLLTLISAGTIFQSNPMYRAVRTGRAKTETVSKRNEE